MMSFLRLPYLFWRTWVKDVACVNFAMLALYAFHTRSWNEGQIEMWKIARKIFDIGKAWIRIPLDRVFGRKFLFWKLLTWNPFLPTRNQFCNFPVGKKKKKKMRTWKIPSYEGCFINKYFESLVFLYMNIHLFFINSVIYYIFNVKCNF